jgi:hypothetical protein
MVPFIPSTSMGQIEEGPFGIQEKVEKKKHLP